MLRDVPHKVPGFTVRLACAIEITGVVFPMWKTAPVRFLFVTDRLFKVNLSVGRPTSLLRNGVLDVMRDKLLNTVKMSNFEIMQQTNKTDKDGNG